MEKTTAEPADRESERQLNSMLKNISGGIALYQAGKDGLVRALMFTDGLPAMQGYTYEEYEKTAKENAIKLVYKEDRDRLMKEISDALQKQEVLSTICRAEHREKKYIWINLTATPVGEDSEGCMRYNAVFTNASYQFELYREMLDTADTGLIVTDRETREVYFSNRLAQEIIDRAKRLCDRKCDFRAGEFRCAFCDASSLLPAEDCLSRKVEVGNRIYQVNTHSMEWMGRPALVQYFSDITEAERLQKRLASDEERYRLVVEKSGMALMDYDLKTDTVYMNERFLQYAVSDLTNRRDFFNSTDGFDTVYPGDVPRMEQFYRDLGEKHIASARVRLKMKDGSFRWTQAGGLELLDKDGEHLREIGFFQDIDEATRQYEDLKIRYDYELTRQQSFEDGVVERILLDLTDNRVIQASNPQKESLSQLIGMSLEDLLLARLLRTEDESSRAQLCDFMNREALLQAYYTMKTPSLEMLTPVSAAGEKKYFLSTAQLAKNPGDGHIIAFIETRDIDRQKIVSTLMERLLETNYKSAFVFRADNGRIKIGICTGEKKFTTDIEQSYDELAAEDIRRRVVPREREQALLQTSLSVIREKLQTMPLYSGRVAVESGGKRFYEMWTATYFDKRKEYILLTIADVTDVHKRDLETARSLKEALESAKVASQAKTTFLARMSHEIRTPITTVSGVLDLIRMDCQRGSICPETLQRQVDTAEAANRYLLTLINDILDISKIEKNELHLVQVPANIQRMVVPMCTMLKPLADKKKIRLNLKRKTRTSNWYRMDATRVQQILMNLLNNAIKFTPEGGTITFTGEAVDIEDGCATIKFVVSDTGVGISEEFKDQVFQPFKREHTGKDSVYEGTGIGLSISRSLARLMGGDITFESEKGKGSTFVATMRLEIVPEQEDETSSLTEEEFSLQSGIHILLCEDNKINQMIIQKILEAQKCRVTTADNGRQAVERFADSPPGTYDLIFMDVRMPVMDGLEATRSIRAMTRADAAIIPIVAMSANAYEEDRQMSLAAGMNAHLSKPVDTKLLCHTIREFVQKSRD